MDGVRWQSGLRIALHEWIRLTGDYGRVVLKRHHAPHP